MRHLGVAYGLLLTSLALAAAARFVALQRSSPSRSSRHSHGLPSARGPVRGAVRRLLAEESGQDTLEYLLVAGGVVVVLAALLIAGFVFILPQIVGTSCPVVDPLGSSGVGECLEP